MKAAHVTLTHVDWDRSPAPLYRNSSQLLGVSRKENRAESVGGRLTTLDVYSSGEEGGLLNH